MLFNNRNYPHPILGLQDDVKGTLEVDSTISSDGMNIQIKPIYRLVNNELQKIIKEGKAHYICHLQCNGTLFREIYKFDKELPSAINISAFKLNGDVELDFLICASETFVYKSNNFHDDYDNQSFTIEKGDVIAYAGKGKFYANLSPDELRSVSALIRIKSYNSKEGPMRLDYSDDRICIELCEDDFEKYRQIAEIPDMVGVIYSGIVLPSLMEALNYMGEDESDEFNTKRWYVTLSKLKEEFHSSQSTLLLAQKILSDPINKVPPVSRALNSLENIFELND